MIQIITQLVGGDKKHLMFEVCSKHDLDRKVSFIVALEELSTSKVGAYAAMLLKIDDAKRKLLYGTK